MRKQKNRCIVADAAGDKEGFTTASIKLRRQKDIYEDFCRKAGSFTQYERTIVGGYDRHLSGKTGAVTRKARAFDRAQIRLTDIENSGTIRLRINLFDKTDPLYLDALSIEEEPGYEDVCLHGSPHSVQKTIDGFLTNMNAAEFAKYLKANGYKGGDIRLAACSTGSGNNSFAQQLSKELGIRVKAPDMDVYYAPDEGVLFVGAPYGNIGRWRIFENGDEIE